MSEYRHLKIVRRGDVTVVRFAEPRLSDSLLLGQLRDELMDVMERIKPCKVLIDFGQVTHGSTVVINCLLDAKARLTAAGGRMKLGNMSPNVRGSYRLLNLDGSVFEIYDSADDALAAF
jgi:anti-anti-sigma regulatory factor